MGNGGSRKILGVDGCRAGWFAVALAQSKNIGVECALFKSLAELWQCHNDAELILVDIPIGLPNRTCPSRACDEAARRWLGRGLTSRVFSPPTREALQSKSHEEACAVNASVVGRKISLQTFNITPKIAEADALLLENPQARSVLRESHPEIAFAAINDGQPIQTNKKSEEGRNERLRALARIDVAAAGWAYLWHRQHRREEVAFDDIIDAIVLALTGVYAKRLLTLPPSPDKDEQNLPMEMVYGRF